MKPEAGKVAANAERTASLIQRWTMLKRGRSHQGIAGSSARSKKAGLVDLFDEEETLHDILLYGVFYVISAALCALLYRICADEVSAMQRDQCKQTSDEGFEHSLFSTSKCGLELCLCSTLCMCIRWPSTLSRDSVGNGGPLLHFWVAFFIFVLLEGFVGVFFGLLWVVHVAVCVYFRHEIRKRFSLPHGDVSTIFQDCMAWACCCCFAAAQEAKQVEGVIAGPSRWYHHHHHRHKADGEAVEHVHAHPRHEAAA